MTRYTVRTAHNTGSFQVPYLGILIRHGSQPVVIDIPDNHPRRQRILESIHRGIEGRVLVLISIEDV